jgi:hypothetical protein
MNRAGKATDKLHKRSSVVKYIFPPLSSSAAGALHPAQILLYFSRFLYYGRNDEVALVLFT